MQTLTIKIILDDQIFALKRTLNISFNLTRYIDAARAEDESDRISKRTIAALSVAKLRGVQLGKFGKTLAKRNKMRSIQFLKRVKPVLLRLQSVGYKTAQSLADELNRRQIKL